MLELSKNVTKFADATLPSDDEEDFEFQPSDLDEKSDHFSDEEFDCPIPGSLSDQESRMSCDSEKIIARKTRSRVQIKEPIESIIAKASDTLPLEQESTDFNDASFLESFPMVKCSKRATCQTLTENSK